MMELSVIFIICVMIVRVEWTVSVDFRYFGGVHFLFSSVRGDVRPKDVVATIEVTVNLHISFTTQTH